jgi:adenosine deaminase
VAGFDLSGDERARVPEPASLIRPLFLHSAPITIHAGEASTAESIWRAVYEYGARRIGHGLRLRENTRLLNYCISEGICMELCPTSNQYTNGFPRPADRYCYESDWREYYPLRYYLERGLDVCINTDNRQLHTHGTLTDDFMCAARLVGGLTRWELLRIVKAGFKHAFLPKREIERMLRSVESRVYQIVTE